MARRTRVHLRTGGTNPSYRESSIESGDSSYGEEDSSAAQRRSARRGTKRKNYNESDSDSDDGSVEVEDDEIVERASVSQPSRAVPQRSSRSAPQQSSQRGAKARRRGGAAAAAGSSSTPTRNGRGRARVSRSGQSQTSKKQSQQRGRRRQLGSREMKRSTKQRGPSISVPTDGKIPAWSTLPYLVLSQIFEYAFEGLRPKDPVQRQISTQAVTWILGAARLCRSFTEPALTALYRCPPLGASLDKPHDLLELLSRDPGSCMFNYRVKIRRLEIDAHRILLYKAGSRGIFDLSALLRVLPRLESVEIFTQADLPPYRQTYRTGTAYQYPTDLGDAIREGGSMVKSWIWNARFVAKNEHEFQTNRGWYDWMLATQKTALQELREVTFSGFPITNESIGGPVAPQISTNAMVVATEQAAAATSGARERAELLESIKDVQSLALELAPDIDASILQEFQPTNLTSLRFENCITLISPQLAGMLETSGMSLQSLTLKHNQSLSLDFLPDLKTHCPRLTEFKFDMKFYSTHATYTDSEPLFDTALEAGHVPAWPATLQHLEIVFLRKIGNEAATAFFQSLLDQANTLRDLRHLEIQATLDEMNWRDRANFRDRVSAQLRDVFLRRAPDPDPHTASLRTFREWRQRTAREGMQPLVVLPGPGPSASPDVVNQELATSTSRRSGRLADQAHATPKYSEESDSASEKPASNVEVHIPIGPRQFIHGLCTVVEITIGNQRPREEQFREADFLDSEVSGDEDWTGENDGADQAGYAW